MPTLRIADLTISLEGAGLLPRGWALLSPFLVPDVASPDLRLDWSLGPAPPQPREAGEAEVTDLPGGLVSFVRWDFEGAVDPVRGTGMLRTSPSAGAVGAALRFAVALTLLERDGLLLHAAAMRIGQRAYVLSGPSGAGKSTAAGLSSGLASVLSDELPALRRGSAGWTAFGTPFHGDLRAALSEQAPLGRLALLEQSATRVELAPLPPAEAVRRLYAQVFRVGVDARRHARWLSLVAALVRDPGCSVLRFRRESSFWEALAA